MEELELAKEKLVEIEKEQTDLIGEMKETYGIDDEDYEDYGFSNTCEEFFQYICEENIFISLDDYRDLEYMGAKLRCKKALVEALEAFNAGDKKSLHNAKKILKEIMSGARLIKTQRQNDIEKAEESIRTMDEIIAICDKFR